MSATAPIPAGYWRDANGSLVPDSKVKDIDKLRHALTLFPERCG